MAILLVLLLVAGFVAADAVLRAYVLAPIGAITAAARRRQQGERDAHPPVLADDELGELASAIRAASVATDEAVRRLEYQVFALDQSAIVSVTDATGRIVDVNDGFCALSGYSRAELVGRTHAVVRSGHHGEDFYSGLWATIKAGRVWRGEICNRAKDGSLYWVSSTIIPSLDAEGSVERFTGAYHDITARVREEEFARASELRTRLVVDSALDAVISMDDAGIITAWNAQAERTFGWTAREAIGCRLSDLIVPEPFRRAHERGLANFRRTREGAVLGQRIEITALRRNGEEFPVELAITALPAADGHFFSAFVRDISERKRAEAELVKAKEAAQQANRAKSDFLATMSHEIRTPMNGVLGFADLLLDSPLDPHQREHAETIRQSGLSLLSLINDILDFSKIEAGRLEIEHVPFDARHAASEAVALMMVRARERGLSLVFDWPDTLPHGLVGDPTRFRQVLLNLVGNAIKFTETGTVGVRAVAAAGDRLLVSVTDRGIGIPQDKIGALFRKFSQADSSTTRRFGGSGLGLAICKQLVGLMDGEIGVESTLGEGSRFWFTLPMPAQPLQIPALIAAVPLPSPAPAPAAVPGTAATAAERADAPHAGVRVLVAEDQPVNQTLAVKVLQRAGCIVDVANNGLEACEMVGLHRYDLVFMDCHMPVRDGFEATVAIRAWEHAMRYEDPSRGRVPIVALTASALKADMDRCYASGMDDFISKPFRPDQLKAALARWAGGAGGADGSEGPLREVA